MTSISVTKGVWFLMRDGTRKKMAHEQIVSPALSIFREHSLTDQQAWFTDGGTTNGVDALDLILRDPNQYDRYGPIPATVDTPTSTVVTLYLRVEIDKAGRISESVLGGPGMDTETIVRHAYRINGRPDPDQAGVDWWTNQINTGRWLNIADFLTGINAAFNEAKTGGMP